MEFLAWEEPKKIMVILAHPDDPEFFMGGTIAEWVQQGHEVSYLLLTKGQKGVSPEFPDATLLEQIRVREQRNGKVGRSKCGFPRFSGRISST